MVSPSEKETKREVPETHTPAQPPDEMFGWGHRPAKFIRRNGEKLTYMVETYPDGSGTILLAFVKVILSLIAAATAITEPALLLPLLTKVVRSPANRPHQTILRTMECSGSKCW